MISVSDAYKELMKSNMRPKCEPIIILTGYDYDKNEEFSITWEAKDITDLQYKRGTDPLGRELPYMELSFTEIYNGLYDEDNMPYKYSNVTGFCKVELSFNQSLTFGNNTKPIENIKLPTLFLTSTPVVEGKRIKWVAKDILSFLNGNLKKLFEGKNINGISGQNILQYILIEARADYIYYKLLFDTITQSIINASKVTLPDLADNIILDDSYNNLLMNYLSLHNMWLDFANDGSITFKNSISNSVKQDFTGEIMYEYPQITKGVDVSLYSFKKYSVVANIENAYEKNGQIINKFYDNEGKVTGVAIRYEFNGYGSAEVWNSTTGKYNKVDSDLTYTIYDGYDSEDISGEKKLRITPLNLSDTQYKVYIGPQGEVYEEDNKLNTYTTADDVISKKANFIKSFLAKDLCDLTINSLPNIALEPTDVISVETEFFKKENDTYTRVIKRGYIKSVELTYNGALKEKIRVGEYNGS